MFTGYSSSGSNPNFPLQVLFQHAYFNLSDIDLNWLHLLTSVPDGLTSHCSLDKDEPVFAVT